MIFNRSKPTPARRAAEFICSALFLVIVMAGSAVAHPLGQFTINHFSRLEIGTNRVNVRYFVDMAEIPTFQVIFGLGSIFGMLLMSCLVGLPFVLGARKLTQMNYALQATASVLSIAFGLWDAYEIGTASGLSR